MWIQFVVIALFIGVVASLGTGFYFLLTEKKSSAKLLNSLKIRISLTVLIMVIIVIAWLHGDIHSQAPWLQRQLHQIHKDKQPDPDHINKMPVPAGSLKAEMVIRFKMPFVHSHQHDRQHDRPQGDVSTVEAG